MEKLLLESLTSNCFNAVLLPCAAPFKLIEVATDINITTSFIAALLSCSSQVQIILLNFLSVHVNCSLYGHWKWISGIKGLEVKKKREYFGATTSDLYLCVT